MSRPFCLILVSLVLSGTSEAEDEKLVLAHYMTDMAPRTDRPLDRWIDPELADPNGSTAALHATSD